MSCGPANYCFEITFLATRSTARILIRNLSHRHALSLTRPAVSSWGGANTGLKKAAEIEPKQMFPNHFPGGEIKQVSEVKQACLGWAENGKKQRGVPHLLLLFFFALTHTWYTGHLISFSSWPECAFFGEEILITWEMINFAKCLKLMQLPSPLPPFPAFQ